MSIVCEKCHDTDMNAIRCPNTYKIHKDISSELIHGKCNICGKVTLVVNCMRYNVIEKKDVSDNKSEEVRNCILCTCLADCAMVSEADPEASLQTLASDCYSFNHYSKKEKKGEHNRCRNENGGGVG